MPNGIVFRFWAFQNFFVSNGSFSWTNLDKVLAIAAAHDDKVIPVLANQSSYCDTAKDLPWYQSGYRTTVEPGDLTTYRAYVATLVSRYSTNSAIAMWQLVNESEAVNSDGTCNEAAALGALLAFSNDVGDEVHSLDPNHLVSLGTLAGWHGPPNQQWCGAANGDYQTLMASAGADVCDYHDYGYPTDPMGIPFAPDLATATQMCHADGKPIMVAETGIYADGVAGLAPRAAEFSAKFSAQFATGVVGELMWSWANSPNYLIPDADPDYAIFPGDPALGVLGTF
jgi:endo-1,4-beta-mannosidase